MAGYSIRPLAEISRTIRGFFVQSLPGAIASVWANTFVVIGKVVALVQYESEQRRAWLFRQIFASLADEVWLARHGYELGINRLPGTPAYGAVTVAATPGLVVPAGLVYVRGDGVSYTTLVAETATGTSVTLTLEADEAGALGNLGVGESLTLSPDSAAPDGLGSEAIVVALDDGAGLAGGADPEELEAYRARVLERKRNPAHGGSAADYRMWVREAIRGVRAVWVDSFVNDTRSVWVQFTVRDQPNGIPSQAQVARVQAYLDDAVIRPVTARVFVSAPSPVPVPIRIKGLSPDTPDIRASIAAETAAVFVDRAAPGTPSTPFVLDSNWIDEAVSRAVGEERHDLLLPAGDTTFASGQLAVPGPITYTD